MGRGKRKGPASGGVRPGRPTIEECLRDLGCAEVVCDATETVYRELVEHYRTRKTRVVVARLARHLTRAQVYSALNKLERSGRVLHDQARRLWVPVLARHDQE